MLKLLLKVQHTLNIPILYVSHNLAELQQVADDIMVMNKGKIEHFGPIHLVIHTLNSSQQSLQQTSLSLKVKEHLPEYGLTSLELTPTVNLYLPLQDNKRANNKEEQDIIRCFIAASDISISKHKGSDSSIVNHFQARINHLKKQDKTLLITLTCSNQVFYSTISLWSAERLSLKIDDLVYIQFKASAVHR